LLVASKSLKTLINGMARYRYFKVDKQRTMIDTTPLLKAYAGLRAYLLQIRDPVETQRSVLQSLLRAARATRFGRDHQFSEITDVAAFQKQVRLRHYEDFWREYWQPEFPRLVDCTWPGLIPYFARSSGTTAGVSKYIPCSDDMIAANLRAGEDVFVHHVLNRPQSRVLAGKCLLLGGSTDLIEEAAGIRSGDLSGIEAREIPLWKRPWFFPPLELALLPDWEEKIDRIGRACLGEDIRAISGTPNWLLLFFDRLAKLTPQLSGLAAVFPRLELIIHGGIDFAPYRDRFRRLLEGTRAETREVYFASESSIAVADRGDGEGLRLLCDNTTFFEFVPVAELGNANPTRHWLANIETGVEYAVVVSTSAGAWAYVLGDTVRFIDHAPPRLLITGRTSYRLSTFGEHVIGEQIEQAIRLAANAIGAAVADYSAVVDFPESEKVGRHLYIVEFADETPDAARMDAFAHRLDQALAAANADYQERRAGNFGLRPPGAQAVAPGTFAAWMKARGRLGGQHKVPRVINDTKLVAGLRDFVAKHRSPSQPRR
jgi:hypothetical protein